MYELTYEEDLPYLKYELNTAVFFLNLIYEAPSSNPPGNICE